MRRPLLARSAVACGLSLLASACVVGLEEIQRQPQVRGLVFKGSYQEVATCVQRRLGAKMGSDSVPERYVVYDSVKGMSAHGLTHYSITIGFLHAGWGYAQWRVVDPRPAGYARTPLSDGAVQKIWNPVEVCAGHRNRLEAEPIQGPAGVEEDQTIFGDDYDLK